MISAKTSIGPRGSQSRTSTGTQDRIIRAKRISRKIHRIQSMTIPMRTTSGLQLPLPLQQVRSAYDPVPNRENRSADDQRNETRVGEVPSASRSALVEEPAGDAFLVLGRNGDVLRGEQEHLAGHPLDGAAEAEDQAGREVD